MNKPEDLMQFFTEQEHAWFQVKRATLYEQVSPWR